MSIHPFPGPGVLRQLRFLSRVAESIPALLARVARGDVEASRRLGVRRLGDGRDVELWLVARAPRPRSGPLLRHHGHDDRSS